MWVIESPATPPLGTGSAHLATNPGFGDGGETIATNNFNGTALSAITSLSYWAYMASNGPFNNQQFPYVALAISTDGNPIQSDGSNLDFMDFEPPYQQHSTGNPSLPDQGPTVLNEWQPWNAQEGGWYDGVIGGNGGDNVQPLSAFIAAYPNAVIADPSAAVPGFEGLNLQVGFADALSTFDGNVDDVTLGNADGTTTYDFEPNAVPEPASFSLLGIGALALLRRRRRHIA
jgi:hypothetical protein